MEGEVGLWERGDYQVVGFGWGSPAGVCVGGAVQVWDEEKLARGKRSR